MHLVADDVQIYLCSDKNLNINEMARQINSDLQKLLEWSKRNLLMANPAKTKAMLINGSRFSPQTPNLFLGNERIQFVEQAPNLGMIFITSHLS